jgi:bla regulator protein BlaR1
MMKGIGAAGLVVVLTALSGCAEPAESEAAATVIVDNIDFPFVGDPALIGTWKSVDFVEFIEEFDPDHIQWHAGFPLKELTFFEGGTTASTEWKWTKGILIHLQNQTAARYVIQEIRGAAYLFFEWKSGDYTIRHMVPWYYVQKKA